MLSKMRISLFMLVFLFVSVAVAQNDIRIDDTFVIQVNKTNDLESFNFPKGNFVRKQGGIPDYNSLDGTLVKVIEMNEDGSAWVKPVNKTTFFKKYKKVKVNLQEALDSQELVRYQEN